MPTDDWRLANQAEFLAGATLVHRRYRRCRTNPTWEHDHCAFCWTKFTVEDQPATLHEGYSTPDEYHWICEQCFHDFQEQFRWQIVTDGSAPA